MSEKYIDLADEINLHVPGTGSHPHPDEDTRRDRRAILRWLDAHPDQAPGRTITESEFHETADAHRNGGLDWEDLADRLGITVVPDPEPTNADKWEKFIRESNPGLSESDVEDMAAHLDQFGVKAPGGK